MIASIIAIGKWLLFILSSGTLYRGFTQTDSNALAAKAAGILTALLTMGAFASEHFDFFEGNATNQSEITIKTEQIFWESVEKHPSEKLYRDYLKAYPEGQFKDIAIAQLAALAPPAPVAQAVNPAPTQPAPVAPIPPQSVQTAKAAEVPESTEVWQTIDHYQVKDGVVRDTKTGLMWMRCSLGQKWNKETKTCEGNVITFTWEEAKKRIDNIYYIEGYGDWRLPSIEELKTLVYCDTGKTKEWNNPCEGDYLKPTIKTEIFLNTSRDWFLSSSPYVNNGNFMRVISFDNGYEDINLKVNVSAVRLVRSEK